MLFRSLKGLINPPDTPVLALDIKFKDLNRLDEIRQEALRNGGLLSDEGEWVSAQLGYEGSTYRVRLRLKGDRIDHLQGRKWSYRVQIQEGQKVLGMAVFSLQSPSTRNFDGEWLYHQALQREGVLGLRYSFARLFINGEDRGIYAVEEHFAKELLEAQERREGPIIKFSEDELWARYARLRQEGIYEDEGFQMARPEVPFHYEAYDSYQAGPPDTFGKTDPVEAPKLDRMRQAAEQLLRAFAAGELPASRVFDVPKLAKYLALSELLDAPHALIWTNVRFYYDPLTARLQPIGFDACPQFGGKALFCLAEPWTLQALADPLVCAAFVTELERVTQPEYVEELRTDFEPGWRAQLRLLQQEWPGLPLADSWANMKARQTLLALALQTDSPVAVYATKAENELELHVANLLPLPVEVFGVKGCEKCSLQRPGEAGKLPYTLAARPAGAKLDYITFKLPRNFGAFPLEVVARLPGAVSTWLLPVKTYGFNWQEGKGRPVAPGLAEALRRHPFLQLVAERLLQVKRGDWRVTGDLVLPDQYGLVAGPGVTLRFEQGALMLATGPLKFEGSKEAPVRLLPQSTSWAGLIVLYAPPSSWSWVEVGSTTSLDRAGWTTTGGVTFYRSPLTLSHCNFHGSLAEDTLNVIGSRVECRDSRFSKAVSDAFDGDFVTGLFERCEFRDIKGDGLDVSGSRELVITGLRAVKMGDKALSIGEGSDVVASDIVAEDCRFGPVSKDRSRLVLKGARLSNCEYGLAAYQKKAEYGPAQLEATGVSFENIKHQLLCQQGSRLTVNGKQAPEQSVDVEALYAGQ